VLVELQGLSTYVITHPQLPKLLMVVLGCVCDHP